VTELGNRLKEARLAKNLSLDDLQSMTKIQKRYLVGIEEGNYSSMPGNFYVRAFIKQYAESLGLNPEEIFETYKNEIPASHNEEIPQQISRVKTHKTISENSTRVLDVMPKVLIAVFVIGIAGLLYYFLSRHSSDISNQSLNKDHAQVKVMTNEKVKANNNGTDSQTNSQKTAESPKKQETAPPPAETAKQEISVVQAAGRNTTYSVKNADKFVVKVVSKGSSWISIKDSTGKSIYQGTLTAGSADSQTADLTSDRMAVIRIGNAADTDIFVNDQKLQYAIPVTQSVQDITIQYVPKS